VRSGISTTWIVTLPAFGIAPPHGEECDNNGNGNAEVDDEGEGEEGEVAPLLWLLCDVVSLSLFPPPSPFNDTLEAGRTLSHPGSHG
jgi:hypothetical protein